MSKNTTETNGTGTLDAVQPEKPGKTVGAELMGKSSEEIKQLFADLDAQIELAIEREDEQSFTYLQARKKFLEAKAPLALATAELSEAEQALSDKEQEREKLTNEYGLINSNCREKREELERETKRLAAERDDLLCALDRKKYERSHCNDEINSLRGEVKEKQLSLDAARAGISREALLAQIQEENERLAREQKHRELEQKSKEAHERSRQAIANDIARFSSRGM